MNGRSEKASSRRRLERIIFGQWKGVTHLMTNLETV